MEAMRTDTHYRQLANDILCVAREVLRGKIAMRPGMILLRRFDKLGIKLTPYLKTTDIETINSANDILEVWRAFIMDPKLDPDYWTLL